jgi:elongation factor P
MSKDLRVRVPLLAVIFRFENAFMSILSHDLRNGVVFMMDGDPWLVLNFNHVKLGRGSATTKIKAQNLKTGAIVEKGFTSSEKFEEANLNKESCQYLYREGDTFYFMSLNTFDQYEINTSLVGDKSFYFKEGDKVIVAFLDEKPIGIEVQKSVILEVAYTEPAVKGDTSGNAMKKAQLETGLNILVPMFINIGDKLKINTDTGTYTERAK